MKNASFTSNLSNFSGLTRPQRSLICSRYLRVRAGKVERIFSVTRCVALEWHSASDASLFVIIRDLKTTQSVSRFNDGCYQAGFDVPFNVAMETVLFC